MQTFVTRCGCLLHSNTNASALGPLFLILLFYIYWYCSSVQYKYLTQVLLWNIVNIWWVQIETENANTYLAIINWSFKLQTLCSITNSSSRIFPQLQKKFSHILWNLDVHNLVQISPKLVKTMSQIIHSKPSYPTSLRQNVILFSYLYVYFPGGFPPGFL